MSRSLIAPERSAGSRSFPPRLCHVSPPFSLFDSCVNAIDWITDLRRHHAATDVCVAVGAARADAHCGALARATPSRDRTVRACG